MCYSYQTLPGRMCLKDMLRKQQSLRERLGYFLPGSSRKEIENVLSYVITHCIGTCGNLWIVFGGENLVMVIGMSFSRARMLLSVGCF